MCCQTLLVVPSRPLKNKSYRIYILVALHTHTTILQQLLLYFLPSFYIHSNQLESELESLCFHLCFSPVFSSSKGNCSFHFYLTLSNASDKSEFAQWTNTSKHQAHREQNGKLDRKQRAEPVISPQQVINNCSTYFCTLISQSHRCSPPPHNPFL